MSTVGDYEDEMFRRSHLDDTSIEQLLSGRSLPGHEALVSFVEDVHAATSVEATRPTSELATLFAEGFSTEKGDLLATAASNVTGPAPQAAGLPKWRKNKMIETIATKLASLGLAAKIGAATGAVALSGTAAAVTGALPDAVQERVAAVAEQVGIDIPGGKSAEHRVDDQHRPAQSGDADVEATEEVESEVEVAEEHEVPETPDKPEAADFGTGVSDAARSGAPQEDGRQFGQDVSDTARETFQPSDRPTAEANPGTAHRSEAGTQQPAQQPTAEANPGTDHRADAGAGGLQPAGTPGPSDNPGSSRRP